MTRGPAEDSGGRPIPSNSTRWSYAPDVDPPRSPARFLSSRSPPAYSPYADNHGTLLTTSTASDTLAPSAHASGVSALEASDIADELGGQGGLHFREGSGNAKKAKKYREYGPIEDQEDEDLLKSTPSTTHESSYPPSRPRVPPARPTFQQLWSHTSTPCRLGHTPIPAIAVFARRAAPLSLPQLDGYISSLPIPNFVQHARKLPSGERQMFPPMDHLAASKKSIEDLEMNRQITPSWRNRSTLTGALTSLVLGVVVSFAFRLPIHF
jgi:hypothetical protein